MYIHVSACVYDIYVTYIDTNVCIYMCILCKYICKYIYIYMSICFFYKSWCVLIMRLHTSCGSRRELPNAIVESYFVLLVSRYCHFCFGKECSKRPWGALGSLGVPWGSQDVCGASLGGLEASWGSMFLPQTSLSCTLRELQVFV